MTVTDLGKLAETTLPEDAEFVTVPDAPGTPEYACEVCGKELTYGGRGRKPRFCEEHKKGSASRIGTAKRSSTKDVDAAVTTLDSWYSMLAMGLFLGGAKKSSALLAESVEAKLTEQNRTFLSQSPALAKRIADMGKTSAAYGFFAAQVAVLGPVAVLATGELMEKWSGPKEGTSDIQREDVQATNPMGFPVG